MRFVSISISVNFQDDLGFIMVSGVFFYKDYTPASIHFAIPHNAEGLMVLDRFSNLFLQRNLTRIIVKNHTVVLSTPELNMDLSRFLDAENPERIKMFTHFRSLLG